MIGTSMQFKWNPKLYDEQHDFVHTFGKETVSLLNPQEDEIILDVGCGTGDLTKIIANSCKKVVGIDNSLEMIRAAEKKYPDIAFCHMDATKFSFDTSFDAVFSNAVLHWVTAPETVIQKVNNHLKTGGRFVAEFGGNGCVNRIISTLTEILDSRRITYPAVAHSLYYPSISEYSRLLERNGFEVSLAMLFDRPTILKGGQDGLKNFIEMFFSWLFDNVSPAEKLQYITIAEKKLKQDLLHDSDWIADYRRIRIAAIKRHDCQATNSH